MLNILYTWQCDCWIDDRLGHSHTFAVDEIQTKSTTASDVTTAGLPDVSTYSTSVTPTDVTSSDDEHSLDSEFAIFTRMNGSDSFLDGYVTIQEGTFPSLAECCVVCRQAAGPKCAEFAIFTRMNGGDSFLDGYVTIQEGTFPSLAECCVVCRQAADPKCAGFNAFWVANSETNRWRCYMKGTFSWETPPTFVAEAKAAFYADSRFVNEIQGEIDWN
ncbi:hypothetical protein CAPTEDRAFT_209730 [Capitella teleta]|uniref:Apple domain-containing protein n=1 Tax=Capitella teleta TaxID=283909 RepID=R7TZ47_CAPTE|nr:hypothetical protein CAPTEDRAFT_209730 [Capitella teleta]|eukprot:ELT96220.1 hypothetical protein CAPTEDRAFT_209730 [Capitella teleta]